MNKPTRLESHPLDLGVDAKAGCGIVSQGLELFFQQVSPGFLLVRQETVPEVV